MAGTKGKGRHFNENVLLPDNHLWEVMIDKYSLKLMIYISHYAIILKGNFNWRQEHVLKEIFILNLDVDIKRKMLAWRKYFLWSFMDIYEGAFDEKLCLSGSTNIDNKFNLQMMEIREAVEEAAETQELHQIQEKV